MSILKAFKSTVREMSASAQDYRSECMDSFNSISGNDKIELKKLIDDSLSTSKRLERSDKMTSAKLYNVVSSFLIENKEYGALESMLKSGLGLEYGLKKSVSLSDPKATRLFLEAGANPNSEYTGKVSKNGLGERYGDFNCLGKAVMQSFNNKNDRDNQDVILALLDHGASNKISSVLVSERGRSPMLSGKELFDLHSPFSIEDYNLAKNSKTFSESPTTSVTLDAVYDYKKEKNPEVYTEKHFDSIRSAKM